MKRLSSAGLLVGSVLKRKTFKEQRKKVALKTFSLCWDAGEPAGAVGNLGAL